MATPIITKSLRGTSPDEPKSQVTHVQQKASLTSLRYNSQRFQLAYAYDDYRPVPPPELLDVITEAAGIKHCTMVVDFGSGTGLSTQIWAKRANMVVGIEPADGMRERARMKTSETNVVYTKAFSHSTGLPDNCADIVTCSQSLHWMEPEATFAEAARILRPNGVFAAYDHEWPPNTLQPELEKFYCRFMWNVKVLENKYQTNRGLKIWPRDDHLHDMRSSGQFRVTLEKQLCHFEPGNSERFIGLMFSKGGIAALLHAGVSEREIGLDNLREISNHLLGDELKIWLFRYRIRLGVV